MQKQEDRRMIGIGFGLERIGLAARRYPVIFSILLVLISIAAASNLPQLRFDGNVTSILPEETDSYRNYFDQKSAYRDSASDLTILIRSDRLMTAEGLEDLRSIHLDAALTDDVESVVSIFSIPDPDPVTGEITQFFPQVIEDDNTAEELVTSLLALYPQASRLIAPEKNTALMVVSLDYSMLDSEESSYVQYDNVRSELEAVAPDDFELFYTGITPIGATIVSALISDQLKLTVIGLLLGTSLAYYIFRSLLSAFICAIPPTLTSLWSLGLFGYFQVPITYLTTVLPTLALILAFADGIVLYFRWQSSNAQAPDLDLNLLRAIRDVGPASALTSITTVLAFLSFSFASGTAMKEFSVLGMAVVSMAFFAVIIGLPLAIHWVIVSGLSKPEKIRRPAFHGIGKRIYEFVSPRSGAISIAAVVIVLALGVVHSFVTPEFRITDFLPINSETRNAEELTNSVAGGRSPIFVSLPKAEDGPALSDSNLERLRSVQTLLTDIYGADRIFSLAEIAGRLETEQAKERLSEQIETALGESRSTFVSRDGKNMLVTVYNPSDQPIAQTLEQISQTRERLLELDWGEDAIVTGFDVLMADEFTRLVEQLRTSLLLAIFLGVMIIGIATRSPMLTVAAITPNLLPILAVELVVWLKGGTVNLSEVIALTISFGIAIDNAVHVINFYNQEIKAGRSVEEAVSRAVKEVAPALAASTTILCTSCLVTQMSILPMVPVLGRLMIATLLFAYIANLLILPANILTISRWSQRGSGQKANQRGES